MTTGKTLRGAAIALAVGLTFVAAGCSAGDHSTDGGAASSGSDSASGEFAGSEGASGSGSDSGSGEAAFDSGTASRDQAGVAVVDVAGLVESKQIRTAQVTLRVESIAESSVKVRGIASAMGGLVQDENSSFGTTAEPEGGSSVITLRVPADQLDPAIGALGKIGTQLDLRTTSEDVTTSIADLDSRVTSQEKSVERMRALLAEANSVKDVIAIESELSTREADLESLQAQARAVKDKAALSTLVVTLDRPGSTPKEKKDEDGFLAGLTSGWDALKGTTLVVLTVLGAVLPLGVAVAVLATPVWFAYRRFGPRRKAVTP